MDHSNLKPHTTPYCYLIGWSKLNRYYYGVRFRSGADPSELWQKYFTSSKLVKQFRLKHGEPDVIQIRKTFDLQKYKTIDNAQQAAVEYETRVIRRMDMVYDDKWLNCSANVHNRTGNRIANHKKYRLLKFDGQYHSKSGVESMRQFNKVHTKENNPMNYQKIRTKHLNSIAKKFGYESYSVYLKTIKETFEKYKTIKVTADKTGHAQFTIRHLLFENFGKEWVESIRKQGLQDAKARSAASLRARPKRDGTGSKNYNAHVWEAISPFGEPVILKGNRLEFCKSQGIGTSLDPTKPHLRGYWEFKKICLLRNYTD